MDEKVLFETLNTELAKENIDLEIICVGGFVLDYYNLRGTQDVDATIKLEVHSLKSVLYFFLYIILEWYFVYFIVHHIIKSKKLICTFFQ